MNIKEAKTEVENAVKAYLIKDKYGKYKIDRVRQRPVLVIGAPGIGKTAIMDQISKEMGIGLISYSMTPHTRQSAIGLPYIEKKTFGGKEYTVSEYTMSEIISSVYKYIEETGIKENFAPKEETENTDDTDNVSENGDEQIRVEIDGINNRKKRNIAKDASDKFEEYNKKIVISKDDDYEDDDYEDDDNDIDYSSKSRFSRGNRKKAKSKPKPQPQPQPRTYKKAVKIEDEDEDDDYYDDDDDEYYKRKEKKTIIAAVITALVIIALISFFGTKFLAGQGIFGSHSSSSSSSQEGDIEVPNFEGYTVEQAEKEAEKLGLKINVSEKDYSDMDEGKIIAQSPIKGEMVTEGTTIDVAVSLGQKSFTMPNVVGEEKDKAIEEITSLGGQKPEIEYEFSDDVKEGLVMEQNPAAQTETDSTKKIVLKVSKGAEDVNVTVPNFVGKDISAVKSELAAAGLQLGSISSQESDKPKDQVIKQLWTADQHHRDVLQQH